MKKHIIISFTICLLLATLGFLSITGAIHQRKAEKTVSEFTTEETEVVAENSGLLSIPWESPMLPEGAFGEGDQYCFGFVDADYENMYFNLVKCD